MRAQNYRPKVRTGTFAKRHTVSPASSTTRSRNSRQSETRGQGARVMWILMIIGGLIGSGFVMAQHSQINVHQLKQTEEKVKTQLDEMTNQQRYLALEKERALNTQESERIAREAGLRQPKLDSSAAPLPKPELVVKPQPPAKASPTLAAKTTIKPGIAKPENKSEGKSAVKAAASATKPAAKPAALSKSAVRLTALAKPAARPIVSKPVSRVAPAGKPVKGGKAQQLAQKQETKKDRRR